MFMSQKTNSVTYLARLTQALENHAIIITLPFNFRTMKLSIATKHHNFAQVALLGNHHMGLSTGILCH